MTRVVADAELLFDQMRHAPTGPQRCLVTKPFWTFLQQLGQTLLLGCTQQRFAAGSPRLPQMRIPTKENADSEGNANGIPGRRRTVFGAQRRWLLDCAASVRLRQEKLSGAKRRQGAASGERGVGKGAAALFPTPARQKPGERQLDGCVPRFLRMESPRISMR